jgi:homoserine kinase
LGLTREEIAQLAAKAEPQSHMDNVTASALGGFNIITRMPLNEHVKITTIKPPRDLGVVVLVPDINKPSTQAGRILLPKIVPTQKYIQAIGYASGVSAAFATGDVSRILETIPWDPIVEPSRADAGFYGRGIDSTFLKEEKELLARKFHVAETISGAGPSRALWYSISEERKARRKNKTGLIKPATELVTNRLKSLGHQIRDVFDTSPSWSGARIVRPA